MSGEDETKTMEAVDLPGQVIELSFHPERDVIATGLVEGKVLLHTYSQEGHKLELELSHHQESCRSVLFSEDGTFLRTASKDRSVAEVAQTGQVTWRQKGAHDWPVNTLYNISANLLASGDDQGVVKVWDVRQRSEVAKFDVNEDFISDMVANEARDKLLATSGDASLAIFDLKQRRVEGRVTNQEDELLSIQLMKHGNRVVCGTQNGVLVQWPWGTWGDRSTRFRGHPHSVDTLLKIDEDTLLTGSSDGIIRVVSVQPDQFLGLLGDHEDFPVESIKFSRDKAWIGSVSHDNMIRFWHAEYLFEEDDEEEGEEDGQGCEATNVTGVGKGRGASANAMDMDSDDKEAESDGEQAQNDDGMGSDSDSDGDSDDDDDDMGGSTSKSGSGKGRGAHGREMQGKSGSKGKAPTATEKFFADL